MSAHEPSRIGKMGRHWKSDGFINNFNDPSFSDVKIAFSDRQVYAHKPTLASRSSYFAAMFSDKFKEVKDAVVELEEDDPAGLDAMLNAMYTNEVPLGFDWVDKGQGPLLRKLILCADKYHLGWLRDECLRLITTYFPDLVYEKPGHQVFRLAQSLPEEILATQTDIFVKSLITGLLQHSRSRSFNDMLEDHPRLAQGLLQHLIWTGHEMDGARRRYCKACDVAFFSHSVAFMKCPMCRRDPRIGDLNQPIANYERWMLD
ncbi:hypothetical protein B9Z65_5619 [Elsinoe australis]|uniref:BTB domain-containing protein n=1 Tax=Elsinoe australis TaxID=40998 RepID=A0A2P7Z3A7_9PEZI|nr:hypothetical protein B9Z65_5619 [Elsinoe australis]